MSFSETIFLFFLALIVFGPKKLPEIARQAGRLLAELRRASNEFRSQIESEIAQLETEKKQPSLPAAPAPAGAVANQSMNALGETAHPELATPIVRSADASIEKMEANSESISTDSALPPASSLVDNSGAAPSASAPVESRMDEVVAEPVAETPVPAPQESHA
jgi:sec-independent protein translocase protein TatB